MAFGKIDLATNYLMSSQKQVDGTWLPLTDFVTDGGGEYYTYYTNPTTPDTDKNTVKADGEIETEKARLVSEITVPYDGHIYSGSEEAQAKLISAASRIKGNSPNKTQNIFDVDHKVVKLTASDIEDILALIEPIYESITDA